MMVHQNADMRFIDYCRKQRRLDAKTIVSYRHILDVFWRYMEQSAEIAEVELVDRDAAQQYLGRMNEIYSVSSVQLHLNVIKTYFNYLEDCEYVIKNPFRRIKADQLRKPEKRPNVLSADEVGRILNAALSCMPETAYEWFLYYRDCTVLDMLFATGMRVQELCSIRMSDIELEAGIIHIIGKRNKYRKCYITAVQTYNLLADYIRVRNECLKKHGMKTDRLLITRFGLPMDTNAVRNLVKKYAQMAGIKHNVTPHSFRHTFASLLVEQGVALSYIQKYLGHSTISTTQIYLHISDDSAKEVLKEKHPRTAMNLAEPRKEEW